MRPTWTQLQPILAPSEWKDLEVLLEFNGPQAVLVERDGQAYLSIASDESAGRTRWLRAPISAMERDALMNGFASLRDCIAKPDILVVDTDEAGAVAMEATVALDRLSEADLPGVDSTLPQVETHFAPERRYIALEGPSVVGHAIGLRPVAELIDNLQRLWNALGQSILGEATSRGVVPAPIVRRSELLLAGLGNGSVVLELIPADAELFADISRKYVELVQADEDAARSDRILGEPKSRIRATYADFLDTIFRHQLRVLARWNQVGALLTPIKAVRVRTALAKSVTHSDEEIIEIKGYFNSFNLREGKFEFVATRDGGMYQGTVAKALIESLDSVTVGGADDYLATIAVRMHYSADGRARPGITRLDDFVRLPADGRNAPTEFRTAPNP